MAVAVINLSLEKGTNFDAKFKILQSDTSNFQFSQSYSGKAKIRKYPTAPIFQEFDVDIIASTGEVVISMGKEKTQLLELGRNYFDILITGPSPNPNGIGVSITTSKVVEGSIIVSGTASL